MDAPTFPEEGEAMVAEDEASAAEEVAEPDVTTTTTTSKVRNGLLCAMDNR